MERDEVLDLYFLPARHQLIELAAFLDRVEKAGAGDSPGNDDYRLAAFTTALRELDAGGGDRAERVLRAFSDPTTDPAATTSTKAASGAWPGEEQP